MTTKAPTKWEVVALALADLGAGSSVVDTEDVAMRVHQLAPAAFSWRKYPDQIDLDSVRVSLTDACKPKYGSLASGSVRTGWTLTPTGVAWAASRSGDIRKALSISAPSTRPEARHSTSHHGREASRVRTSAAFRQWTAGDTPSTRSVKAAFRIDIYTSERDREMKVNRMLQAALALDDRELERFVLEMTDAALLSEGPAPMNQPKEPRSE